MSNEAKAVEDDAEEFLNNLTFLRELINIRLTLQQIQGESLKPATEKLDTLITHIITELSEETE